MTLFTILICCSRKKGFRHLFSFIIKALTYTYVPSRLAHFTHFASIVWNRKTQRSLVRGRGTSILQIIIWKIQFHKYSTKRVGSLFVWYGYTGHTHYMEYMEQGYLILHNKIINEMMDGQQKICDHLNMIKLKDQWSVVWNNTELTLFLLFMINEPWHDFQQCGILNSVDSDEPVQSPLKRRNSKCCSVSSLTLIE